MQTDIVFLLREKEKHRRVFLSTKRRGGKMAHEVAIECYSLSFESLSFHFLPIPRRPARTLMDKYTFHPFTFIPNYNNTCGENTRFSSWNGDGGFSFHSISEIKNERFERALHCSVVKK